MDGHTTYILPRMKVSSAHSDLSSTCKFLIFAALTGERSVFLDGGQLLTGFPNQNIYFYLTKVPW